jgi:acyl carrier protein
MPETLDTVKQVLGDVLQLGARAERLTAATPILGSMPEFDSMAVVTLIAALEETFGVVVNDDEVSAATFETVGSLAQLFDEKLAG